METDQLIRTLAADNASRSRPVGSALAVALLVAAPFSIAAFFATLGFRSDIRTAMHNPFFDFKFVVTMSLAVSAIAVGVHLSRPDASPRGWLRLLLIPLVLVLLSAGVEMMLPHSRPWLVRLIGNNSRVCLTAIPALSLPLLVASLIALRHGAPTRPALTGALAGLLSAGLAATLYAAQCNDDSPLFVLTWYSIAAALVAAVGALAGSKLLRY
ncbi:MAG TPA: DUF1109 domain-containing protein [Nitrobacter sp.]|jgi:hypothetical protein|nr:DUF1109 domain-containing protein [Nitrobacter sp.]